MRSNFKPFLALLAGFTTWLLLRRGGGDEPIEGAEEIPLGETKSIKPACGGNKIIGPFKGVGVGRPAQVMILVKSACGQTEATIEVGTEKKWTPVEAQEKVLGGNQNVPPKVGSWYAVAVPNKEYIRLTCPAGDGTCEFEVSDITKPNPANPLTLTITGGENAPKCGVRGTSRLFNLSDGPVKVTVNFKSLCGVQGRGAQKALIHSLPARKRLGAKADIPVNPAAAPAQTSWTGNLDSGYTLEVSCTGNLGDCKFEILVRA